MESEINGYVIVSVNHPRGGEDSIFESTFRYLRRDCVKDFVHGSGGNWKYWREKYGFKCVKAKSKITTL